MVKKNKAPGEYGLGSTFIGGRDCRDCTIETALFRKQIIVSKVALSATYPVHSSPCWKGPF